tara:strand:- start:570 stop:1232 length:663 start_codon:yes stop_codon:yes gene_type:complete
MTKKKNKQPVNQEEKKTDTTEYDMKLKKYVDFIRTQLELPVVPPLNKEGNGTDYIGTTRMKFRYKQKINNIRCNIEFNKFIHYETEKTIIRYTVEISSMNMYLNTVNDIIYNESCEDFDTLMEQVLLVFNTYKYCKINNLFATPERCDFNKLIYDLFDNETDNKCSVCYDYTTTTTMCNHKVCLECLENFRIKKISSCPICRKCLCCGTEGDCYDNEDDY